MLCCASLVFACPRAFSFRYPLPLPQLSVHLCHLDRNTPRETAPTTAGQRSTAPAESHATLLLCACVLAIGILRSRTKTDATTKRHPWIWRIRRLHATVRVLRAGACPMQVPEVLHVLEPPFGGCTTSSRTIVKPLCLCVFVCVSCFVSAVFLYSVESWAVECLSYATRKVTNMRVKR